ncbi:unnamed protein product, partial [Porites evermanni]
SVYKNCAELYEAGVRNSGVYTIDPDNAGTFQAYCDQTTAGGGWTVFQKRLDGSVDFYRGWDDYEHGFGDLNGEFWLGLDKIHRLTKKPSKLRVELEDFASQTAYAEYDDFGSLSLPLLICTICPPKFIHFCVYVNGYNTTSMQVKQHSNVYPQYSKSLISSLFNRKKYYFSFSNGENLFKEKRDNTIFLVTAHFVLSMRWDAVYTYRFFSHSLFLAVLVAEYNGIIIFKEPINDKVLPGHVIRTEMVPNEGSCRVKCFLEPNCVSINVGPEVEGTRTCKLKNFTDESGTQTGLEEKKGYIHFAVENFCHRSRCPGKYFLCQVGFTNKGYRCFCPEGFKGDRCDEVYKNCAELYEAAVRNSGIYTIDPDNAGTFQVYCDQTTAGGGWTVFQKRLDGSVDFYRGWDDYKHGFGDLNGDKLRVELEDFGSQTAYAEYDDFGVANEQGKYMLSLGKYFGTAGDSLSYHRGIAFSTKDQDNDHTPYTSCAKKFKGAWWYKRCHESNLNGLYRRGYHHEYAVGVNWKAWKGYHHSFKRAEMKIKPVGI